MDVQKAEHVMNIMNEIKECDIILKKLALGSNANLCLESKNRVIIYSFPQSAHQALCQHYAKRKFELQNKLESL